MTRLFAYLLCGLLLTSGCSLTQMRVYNGPGTPPQRPRCDSSYVPAAADFAWAATYIGHAVAFLAALFPELDEDNDEIGEPHPWRTASMIPLFAAGAAHFYSGYKGIGYARSCRRAKTEAIFKQNRPGPTTGSIPMQ